MVTNDKHFTHTYFAIISHTSFRHMKIKKPSVNFIIKNIFDGKWM